MRSLDRMGENGLKYPEYQLLEAYLLHLEGEDDQASETLSVIRINPFITMNWNWQGIYLYLCTDRAVPG